MALLEPSVVTEGAAAPTYCAVSLLEAAILQQGWSQAVCLGWAPVGQSLVWTIDKDVLKPSQCHKNQGGWDKIVSFCRVSQSTVGSRGARLRMVAWGGGRKTPGFPIMVIRTSKAVFRTGPQLFSAMHSCGGRSWSSSGTKWSELRLKSYS